MPCTDKNPCKQPMLRWVHSRACKELVAQFKEKDRQYKQQDLANCWPGMVCNECVAGGKCCKSTWHHIGDCCLHCGNDEREL